MISVFPLLIFGALYTALIVLVVSNLILYSIPKERVRLLICVGLFVLIKNEMFYLNLSRNWNLQCSLMDLVVVWN